MPHGKDVHVRITRSIPPLSHSKTHMHTHGLLPPELSRNHFSLVAAYSMWYSLSDGRHAPRSSDRFDGKHPTLACGTTGGKIFLHSPYARQDDLTGSSPMEVKYLNINRKVWHGIEREHVNSLPMMCSCRIHACGAY